MSESAFANGQNATNPSWEVKVYLLNDSGDWDDCGTGFLEEIQDHDENEYLKILTNEQRIKGRSSTDISSERYEKLKGKLINDDEVLLFLPIVKRNKYEIQLDHIIAWSDVDLHEEIAISFLDQHIAKKVWGFINMKIDLQIKSRRDWALCAQNKQKVQSFVGQDPNADFVGKVLDPRNYADADLVENKNFSLYITQKEPNREGFEFEGYLWNAKGFAIVKEGYITPENIKFVTICEKKAKNEQDPVTHKRISYIGYFSAASLSYAGAIGSEIKNKGGERPSRFVKRFTLKNQKVMFRPSKLPLPPFFLYKQDVFDETKKQYPEKNSVELTSLIAQTWNSLREEKQNVYKQNYEKLLTDYKKSWKDPSRQVSRKKILRGYQEDELEASGSKKPKISPKNCCLTHIFAAITYEKMNDDSEVMDKKIKYENHLSYDKSWLSAFNNIKKILRKLMKVRDLLDEEYRMVADNYANLDFQATIIDLADGTEIPICQKKLELELNKQMQSFYQTKKLLVTDILREKGFCFPIIKDVMSFLPTHENPEVKPLLLKDQESIVVGLFSLQDEEDDDVDNEENEDNELHDG